MKKRVLNGISLPSLMPTIPKVTTSKATPKLRTPAEEVWLLVQQWYFSRGKLVPADEEKVCKDEIAKEAIKISYTIASLSRTMLNDSLSEASDFKKKADILGEIAKCDAILAANPELKPIEVKGGSHSFWKDYWAKKKAAGWVSTRK